MRSQSRLVHGAGFHALNDFLAGKIEQRIEYLCALLLVRLRNPEEHPCTVLNVAGRLQLPLQHIHDHRRFAAYKATRIATAIQFGEERQRPFVMELPDFVEQLRREAAAGFYGEDVG